MPTRVSEPRGTGQESPQGPRPDPGPHSARGSWFSSQTGPSSAAPSPQVGSLLPKLLKGSIGVTRPPAEPPGSSLCPGRAHAAGVGLGGWGGMREGFWNCREVGSTGLPAHARLLTLEGRSQQTRVRHPAQATQPPNPPAQPTQPSPFSHPATWPPSLATGPSLPAPQPPSPAHPATQPSTPNPSPPSPATQPSHRAQPQGQGHLESTSLGLGGALP